MKIVLIDFPPQSDFFCTRYIDHQRAESRRSEYANFSPPPPPRLSYIGIVIGAVRRGAIVKITIADLSRFATVYEVKCRQGLQRWAIATKFTWLRLCGVCLFSYCKKSANLKEASKRSWHIISLCAWHSLAVPVHLKCISCWAVHNVVVVQTRFPTTLILNT